MNPSSKIYVAGHQGLVGSALVRQLRARGYHNLICRTRSETDLEDPVAVRELFEAEHPEYVFLAAARVGGIWANDTFPVEFMRSNLAIQLNVLEAAWRGRVRKLVFLGSSCIYPKHAPQPIREEYLLTGPLEPTNEPYALAKIAGIKLCESYNRQYGTRFISVMPTNLYGPGDNFDLQTSHVIPALLRRFHEARVANAPAVTVWGSGRARREFLHVDDLADACIFVMRIYDAPTVINIGCGQDLSISEAAALVRDTVGYPGQIVFDERYPDGTPRKLLDVSKLQALGWRPSIPLERGLANTYAWFLEHAGRSGVRGVAPPSRADA